MNNNPIGIFDSGVGGLSILEELRNQLPHESFIYFADQKHCPYGNRTSEEIYKYSKAITEFLLKKNIKLMIIACNSVTVTSMERLRREFPAIPIIGIVPVVKMAAERSKRKKIGILSTAVTAKSSYQKNLIDTFAKDCLVVNIGTDRLVPIVEKGAGEEEVKEVLRKELLSFQRAGVDVIALGCSHFPFLEKYMGEILGPAVLLLDSAAAVARQTKRVLQHNEILSSNEKPVYTFYTTGDREQFEKSVLTLVSYKFADEKTNVHSISLIY